MHAEPHAPLAPSHSPLPSGRATLTQFLIEERRRLSAGRRRPERADPRRGPGLQGDCPYRGLRRAG